MHLNGWLQQIIHLCYTLLMSNEEPMLHTRVCKSCEGGIPPLTSAEIQIFLRQTPEWVVNAEEKQIEREWKLADFKTALDFINKVGALAEEEGHHPDILLHSWNKVKITLSTHAIGGLSDNDFILAAKIDRLQ